MPRRRRPHPDREHVRDLFVRLTDQPLTYHQRSWLTGSRYRGDHRATARRAARRIQRWAAVQLEVTGQVMAAGSRELAGSLYAVMVSLPAVLERLDRRRGPLQVMGLAACAFVANVAGLAVAVP